MSETPHLDGVTVLMFVGFAGFFVGLLWDNWFIGKVSITLFLVAVIALVFLGMRV